MYRRSLNAEASHAVRPLRVQLDPRPVCSQQRVRIVSWFSNRAGIPAYAPANDSAGAPVALHMRCLAARAAASPCCADRRRGAHEGGVVRVGLHSVRLAQVGRFFTVPHVAWRTSPVRAPGDRARQRCGLGRRRAGAFCWLSCWRRGSCSRI